MTAVVRAAEEGVNLTGLDDERIAFSQLDRAVFDADCG
jgi:hypothetical protein